MKILLSYWINPSVSNHFKPTLAEWQRNAWTILHNYVSVSKPPWGNPIFPALLCALEMEMDLVKGEDKALCPGYLQSVQPIWVN